MTKEQQNKSLADQTWFRILAYILTIVFIYFLVATPLMESRVPSPIDTIIAFLIVAYWVSDFVMRAKSN